MSADAARATSWRHWAARAALIVAVAGAMSLVAGAVPRDQTLVFWARGRLITELRATFSGEEQKEPLGGVTLRPAHRARERLKYVIALPHGDYVIHVEAALAPAPNSGRRAIETSVTRRVTLDGTETVIPLPESPR
ncbi:MAG TPA: hypothetical protein VF989_13475 [Polyangiaceae bacterium]